MGKKLDEFGEPDMSGAVRPMALSPDEHFVYFQVSFFHGFVEYDLQQDRVTRRRAPAALGRGEVEAARRVPARLGAPRARDEPGGHEAVRRRDDVGLRGDRGPRDRSPTGSRPHGHKPYWATNTRDGSYCFVSFSGDDAVSVISYRKRREIARIPVGDHPQRMRMGKVRAGWLGTQKPRR